MYSTWKLRRRIMADRTLNDSTKLYALVIQDNIDWTTGIKNFDSDDHMLNWLQKLSETNNLLLDAFIGTLELMANSNLIKVENQRLTLSHEE